jgi:peroxiredoxin
VKYFSLGIAAVVFAAVATGPSVGSQAPAFTAVDTQGHVQTLKSIMGPKGALLVFFRSADW